MKKKLLKKFMPMLLAGAMVIAAIPLSFATPAKAAETSILKGKKTTCTYQGDSGHGCNKAVDEKFNKSRWGANNKTPQAIQIDLGDVYEIDTIKAYLFGKDRKYTYEYYVTMEPTILKENGGNGSDNFVGKNPVVTGLQGVGYGWADPDGTKPTPESEIHSEDYTFKNEKPVGRYLTLRVTKCSSIVCVWDIQAFGKKVDPPVQENILKGKTTTCTYQGDSGHACKKAVDEKYNTSRWGSNNKTPQAIQIDLGDVYEIDTVKSYLFGKDRKYTYEYYVTMEPTILKENGGNGDDNFVGKDPVVTGLEGVGYGWADPEGKTPTPESEIRSEDYTFKGEKPVGRYLTLRVTKCSHIVCLWDIQAFGKKVDASAVKPKGDLVLEAEKGTLNGRCQKKDANSCSNGQYVGYIGEGEDNTITWKANVDKAGIYTLEAYFLSKEERSLEFKVNDDAKTTLACQSGFDWDNTVVKSNNTITVKLKAGENIIVMGNDDGEAPNVDYVALTFKEEIKESDTEQDTENKDPDTEQDTENKDPDTEQDTENKDPDTEQDTENKDPDTEQDTENKDSDTELDTENKDPDTEQDTENKDSDVDQDTETKAPEPEEPYEPDAEDKDTETKAPEPEEPYEPDAEDKNTENKDTETEEPDTEDKDTEKEEPDTEQSKEDTETKEPDTEKTESETQKQEEPGHRQDNETTEQTNPQPNPQPPVKEQPAEVSTGDLYWYKNLRYRVTKTDATGKGTVELVSTKNKKVTSVVIPATIEIEGQKYNVTSIGKNAFKNCKKLKRIVIKTVQLKKVGKNALKGIRANAEIKVPASKVKKYTRLFEGKGQRRTVKINILSLN